MGYAAGRAVLARCCNPEGFLIVMKLTPRRKRILCVVAAVYVVGLSIELWNNYHFCPSAEEVAAALQERCRVYRMEPSDFVLAQEPEVTPRVFSDSYWYGKYRHKERDIELELIMESDGEVFSLVTP